MLLAQPNDNYQPLKEDNVPLSLYRKGKGEGRIKAIPVTGRVGPQGCETSRFPHFLDNRRTNGGEVVSLTCLPPFNPGGFPVLISIRG
jgi:hypothetical protein